MKKPFVSFREPKDIAKLILCIVLSVYTVSLFFIHDESVTVFADGTNGGGGSLYGLLGSML